MAAVFEVSGSGASGGAQAAVALLVAVLGIVVGFVAATLSRARRLPAHDCLAEAPVLQALAESRRDTARCRDALERARLAPALVADPDSVAGQRATLVATCCAVHDMVQSEAVRTKLRRALSEVGADDETLARHRALLVGVCMEVGEMVRSDDVRGRLRLDLGGAGIDVVEPDGERFDPEMHEAMFTEPTADANLVDRIHSTVYPGYRDGGKVLRDPKVVVWTAAGPSSRS